MRRRTRSQASPSEGRIACEHPTSGFSPCDDDLRAESREHGAEGPPRVFQETRFLAEQAPSHLRGEIDVPVLLDDSDHLRLAEDVEQLLHLAVPQRRERLENREVLP